jgi:hypothetical protein
MCRYLSSECTHSTTNPYGHVSSASLRLEGHVVPGLDFIEAVRLVYATRKRFQELCIVHLDAGPLSPCLDSVNGEECKHEDLHTGWEETVSDWASVTVFALHSWTHEKLDYYLDLLLLRARLGSDGKYVRFGLANGLGKAWFDEHASPASVTIT